MIANAGVSEFLKFLGSGTAFLIHGGRRPGVLKQQLQDAGLSACWQGRHDGRTLNTGSSLDGLRQFLYLLVQRLRPS